MPYATIGKSQGKTAITEQKGCTFALEIKTILKRYREMTNFQPLIILFCLVLPFVLVYGQTVCRKLRDIENKYNVISWQRDCIYVNDDDED